MAKEDENLAKGTSKSDPTAAPASSGNSKSDTTSDAKSNSAAKNIDLPIKMINNGNQEINLIQGNLTEQFKFDQSKKVYELNKIPKLKTLTNETKIEEFRVFKDGDFVVYLLRNGAAKEFALTYPGCEEEEEEKEETISTNTNTNTKKPKGKECYKLPGATKDLAKNQVQIYQDSVDTFKVAHLEGKKVIAQEIKLSDSSLGKQEESSVEFAGDVSDIEIVWFYFTDIFKAYCLKHRVGPTYSLNVITNDGSFKFEIKQASNNKNNDFGDQMVRLTEHDGIYNLQYQAKGDVISAYIKLSKDSTPVLIYSTKNPTVGFVDTTQRVALIEPAGLQEESITVFGEVVKPIGMQYRAIRKCFDQHGTLPSKENEWQPTVCLSCFEMYNVSYHMEESEERTEDMAMAVALCPDFDFAEQYGSWFEQHPALWVAVVVLAFVVAIGYFAKWFGGKWGRYQKARAKRTKQEEKTKAKAKAKDIELKAEAARKEKALLPLGPPKPVWADSTTPEPSKIKRSRTMGALPRLDGKPTNETCFDAVGPRASFKRSTTLAVEATATRDALKVADPGVVAAALSQTPGGSKAIGLRERLGRSATRDDESLAPTSSRTLIQKSRE